jgi:PncC family amidohydrolase
MTTLQACASEVAAALARTGRQLVLAESCTAGLVAASLGGVPGLSRHLCGSAVVYQEPTKTAWLDVPAGLIDSAGVVSAEVAAAMTAGAIRRTPRADIAAAVTGHLGPNAPADLDGVIYVSVELRGDAADVVRHRLDVVAANDPMIARQVRQIEAAVFVLRRLAAALEILG